MYYFRQLVQNRIGQLIFLNNALEAAPAFVVVQFRLAASIIRDSSLVLGYVHHLIAGQKRIGPIPERRPPIEERKAVQPKSQTSSILSPPLPVWRCKVCGYIL